MLNSLRHFFTNMVCGLIWNKDKRKKVRVILNSSMGANLRFIRRDIGVPIRHVKTFTGYQARNLIIAVNKKYVYKFPLRRNDSNKLALREKRIVDALIPYSSIFIPPVEILHFRGQLVRKYPYVAGVSLRCLPIDVIKKNKDKLAKQIAQFVYEIGCADPTEIRDLKPNPDAKPAFMTGWFQGDIPDNFIIDPKTMNIVAFIDWEDSIFVNFAKWFTMDKGEKQLTVLSAAAQEYARIYEKMNNKK